ncbi:MAG: YegS/Rv2252/BmrU family lipid kinase [Spirochaetia bacterium]|nr:YegS/Rv2252/BmrU family lipid kinase [Spirochaetia bacterium]
MARHYKHLHVIINPNSSGGATGRQWSELSVLLQKRLGEFTHRFTEAPGAAIRLASEAATSGADLIVVVGGDGTISETVNGVMNAKKGKRPKLAVINQGTGGDFVRSLGVPGDVLLALDAIERGREAKVDVGRLEFIGNNGLTTIRYFVNVAGCGMAGEVVRSVNSSKKRFGAMSYYLGAVGKLLSYKNKRVRLTLDDGDPSDHSIVSLAICNGQFFGGGMLQWHHPRGVRSQKFKVPIRPRRACVREGSGIDRL